MSAAPRIEKSAKTAPWWMVVLLLLGIPLALAATLNAWLGVPEERVSPESVLLRFSLPNEGIEKARGLEYAELVFLRLELTAEAVAAFEEALAERPYRDGPAQAPITLKVKRDWWDLPTGVEGRTWELPGGQIFRMDSDVRQYFLVAGRPRSGAPPALAEPNDERKVDR